MMSNRVLCGYDVFPLAFGTSTFVKGKLSPDADSETGIAALRSALKNGVNVIHSMSSLGTQWGVRQVLDTERSGYDTVHIIKKKTDRPFTPEELGGFVDQNIASLGGGRAIVQIEFSKNDDFDLDRKIEFLKKITAPEAVARYPILVHLANEKDADDLIGIEGISGFTVKYNSENTWIEPYLHKIEATSADLVVMSPFNRVAPPNKACVEKIFSDILSHGCVKCIVLSSTDTTHWYDNISAAKQLGGSIE